MNEVRFTVRVSDYEDTFAIYEVVVDLVTKKVQTTRVSPEGRHLPGINLEDLSVELTKSFVKRKARRKQGVLASVYCL